MGLYSLKQIALTLGLIASLFAGSATACFCGHHQEESNAEVSSCHSGHEEPVENVSQSSDSNQVDLSCSCFVDQPAPAIYSKSEGTKAKFNKNASAENFVQVAPLYVATTLVSTAHSGFRNVGYSFTFSTLKPSRAPPRL